MPTVSHSLDTTFGTLGLIGIGTWSPISSWMPKTHSLCSPCHNSHINCTFLHIPQMYTTLANLYTFLPQVLNLNQMKQWKDNSLVHKLNHPHCLLYQVTELSAMLIPLLCHLLISPIENFVSPRYGEECTTPTKLFTICNLHPTFYQKLHSALIPPITTPWVSTKTCPNFLFLQHKTTCGIGMSWSQGCAQLAPNTPRLCLLT